MSEIFAIKPCDNVKEQLESDLALEMEAIAQLNASDANSH